VVAEIWGKAGSAGGRDMDPGERGDPGRAAGAVYFRAMGFDAMLATTRGTADRTGD